MNSDQEKFKRVFKVVFVAVCLVLIGIMTWGIIESGRFKLVSTDPKNEASVPPDSVLIFTFNRDVDTASVTLEPEIGYQTVASGKTITLIPYTTFSSDTTYTYTLTEATSRDGKTVRNKKGSFSVRNTASSSEQNTQVSKDYNSEERTTYKYAFLKNLAHTERAFTISYRPESKPYTHPIYDSKKYKDITILIALRPETLAGPLSDAEFSAELNKSRQKALDWMRSLELNPSDFIIEYTPDPDAVETAP